MARLQGGRQGGWLGSTDPRLKVVERERLNFLEIVDATPAIDEESGHQALRTADCECHSLQLQPCKRLLHKIFSTISFRTAKRLLQKLLKSIQVSLSSKMTFHP
jgi:hypothetical protein